MLTKNLLIRADSYKYSQWLQYPKNNHIFANLGPRYSTIPGVHQVIPFGAQAFCNKILLPRFTAFDVKEAEGFITAHGEPFNYDGFMDIAVKHHGRFPVKIRSVLEGTPIPVGNTMLNIQETDSAHTWVVGWLETQLMQYCWYGSTVATISRECQRIILTYMRETGADLKTIRFKLQDFGFRGVIPGGEGLGGAAHLINFNGTDTTAGLAYAIDFYSAVVCAFSIPAMEHSTVTSWGKENEIEAYWNMARQFALPGKIFAVVIDSYDSYDAIKKMHESGLFDYVKQNGATIVLRPDSGNPVLTPIRLIEYAMQMVGGLLNSQEFWTLPDHIRFIQGDGINIESLADICDAMWRQKLSMDNLSFGMGGGLLQQCNRDTFGFAMKCSSIGLEDGTSRDVYKETPGKESFKGEVELYHHRERGEYKTCRIGDQPSGFRNAMHLLYQHNGNQTTFNETDFAEIQKRAALP